MKKLILLLLPVFCISCSQKNEEKSFKEDVQLYSCYYTYYIGMAVPDSLRDISAEWIQETCRAMHQGLSAGDYEDPQYTLNAIVRHSIKIYGIDIEGLEKKVCETCMSSNFIPYNKLSKEEKELFNKIKPN